MRIAEASRAVLCADRDGWGMVGIAKHVTGQRRLGLLPSSECLATLGELVNGRAAARTPIRKLVNGCAAQAPRPLTALRPAPCGPALGGAACSLIPARC